MARGCRSGELAVTGDEAIRGSVGARVGGVSKLAAEDPSKRHSVKMEEHGDNLGRENTMLSVVWNERRR